MEAKSDKSSSDPDPQRGWRSKPGFRPKALLKKVVFASIIGVVWLVVLSGLLIGHWSSDHIYYDVAKVPAAEVVIVPGARVFPDGRPSLMVQGRVDSAVALFDAGTVNHVLVSGDNSDANYNEPVVMQGAVVAAGVDPALVTLDYAGFDTWDTCLRAREQFGVTSAVVVTQPLHAERTAALCNEAGIDAHILVVDPPYQRRSTKLIANARERLAKVKATGDIVRKPGAHHGGPFIGLVGSTNMPEGGHPPDWNWSEAGG